MARKRPVLRDNARVALEHNPHMDPTSNLKRYRLFEGYSDFMVYGYEGGLNEFSKSTVGAFKRVIQYVHTGVVQRVWDGGLPETLTMGQYRDTFTDSKLGAWVTYLFKANPTYMLCINVRDRGTNGFDYEVTPTQTNVAFTVTPTKDHPHFVYVLKGSIKWDDDDAIQLALNDYTAVEVGQSVTFRTQEPSTVLIVRDPVL